MLTLLPEEAFLTHANGRARTRVFDTCDYQRYRRVWEHAQAVAHRGEPFYVCEHAGAVTNRSSYRTSTARWAVWTTNAGQVVSAVDRVPIRGRHVPCAYHGGVWQYLTDFRRGAVAIGWPAVPMAIDEAPERCTGCDAPLGGVFYTGQRWGDTLCEPCYDARVAAGLARPVLVEA